MRLDAMPLVAVLAVVADSVKDWPTLLLQLGFGAILILYMRDTRAERKADRAEQAEERKARREELKDVIAALKDAYESKDGK